MNRIDRIAHLKRLHALVLGWHQRRATEAILVDLRKVEGARLQFAAGTHELRLAGVVGTCTSGGDGLIRS